MWEDFTECGSQEAWEPRWTKREGSGSEFKELAYFRKLCKHKTVLMVCIN